MEKHIIYVNKEVRKILMEKYAVCGATISMALNFQNNSKLKREIRSDAMNFYNGLFLKCPE